MRATTREPLNRQRICEVALRLVDAEGLAALSMRRLGHELGVEAMSLYHHVPNKAALLGGIAELLLGRLQVPPAGAGDWRERMTALARAYRRLAHDHPHAFPLVVAPDLKTAEVRRLLDPMVPICRDAGFADGVALDAFCIVAGYVSGYALFEIGGLLQPAPDGAGDRLGGGAPSGDRSAPSSLVALGDAQFEFGLEVVLTGLNVRLATPPVATGSPAAFAIGAVVP